MRTVLLHDHYDEIHLEEVKAEMKIMGAPRIKAIFDGEIYGALEGCHRLRAAYDLGLMPVIEEVNPGDVVTIEIDGDATELTYEQGCDIVFGGRTQILDFNEDWEYDHNLM